MDIKKWAVTLLIGISIFGFVGCEDEDLDDIAKGQECMDDARTAADAISCRKYVSGSSTAAKILSCSVEIGAGGLLTEQIKDAFVASESASNKEETLIEQLAMADDAQAELAYDKCEDTEVAGLTYLAGIILIGTKVTNAAGSIAACATGNSCDADEIGEVAVDLADTYCTGDNEDTEVCQDVDEAIANGSTNEEIGQALLDALNDN